MNVSYQSLDEGRLAGACKPERGRCRIAAAVRVGGHRAARRDSEINVTWISRKQQLLEELRDAFSWEATSVHRRHRSSGEAASRSRTEHGLMLLCSD